MCHNSRKILSGETRALSATKAGGFSAVSSPVKKLQPKCLFLSSCQDHGRFHTSLFAASNSRRFPFLLPTSAVEGTPIGIGVRCDSVEGGFALEAEAGRGGES